jgi:hypothetical protein
MNQENEHRIPAGQALDETAEAELRDDELETVTGGAGGYTVALNPSKNANNSD